MRRPSQLLLKHIQRLSEQVSGQEWGFRAALLKYWSAQGSIEECLESPFFADIPDSLLSTVQSAAHLPCEIKLEHFALAYETSFSREHSKKKGLFYTPEPIVEHIVDGILKDWDKVENFTLLDPACGAGIFLLAALEQLGSAKCRPLSEIITNSLFGVDIDSGAVELCQLLLKLKLRLLGETGPLPDLGMNILQGNSLISPSQLEERKVAIRDEFNAFSYRTSFRSVFEGGGGFDFIVGNPPYGLSRGDQLSPEENAALKKIYSSTLSGKPNKYMLFMARSYQLLRDGGICSYIVPNSWLGIQSGRALRQMFLSAGALTNIEVLEFPAFEDLSVETVIFRCKKPGGSRVIRISHLTDTPAINATRSIEVETEACTKTPGLTIPLNWSSDTDKLIAAINERCVPMREHKHKLVPLIALQAYATGKGRPPQTDIDVRNRVFHTARRESEDCVPYLEGADVRRYSVSWSGKYLKFGPWLAEYHPLSRFSGTRLLIREILAPAPYALTCALMRDTAVYNRSILHIIPGPEGGVDDILGLLAILNSRLASKIIMTFGQKSQRRLFPKVVNEDLRNFPLPKTWTTVCSELSSLASERCSHDRSSYRQIEDEIERKVEEIYGLRD